MFIVYIIQSQKDYSYYTGQTNDINDRLIRHNQGRNKYTKNRTPWKLVYTKKCKTRKESVKCEHEIKKKKSRKYIEFLIQNKMGL